MIDRAEQTLEAWGDRRAGGVGAAGAGTSGARQGTSGLRTSGLRTSGLRTSGVSTTAWGWGLAATLLVIAALVNVMTQLDDARRRGVHLPLALPLTLELTSAVASLCSVIIVVIALRVAPPGRGPWWRTLAVYGVGSLAFSVAHVMLMTLLRAAIAALARYPYSFSLSELPYEYRKDLITYGVIGGFLWLLSRQQPPLSPGAETAADTGPSTFDIRDGASILRVAVAEIVVATAAGNYVEFALEDGRRPLMRASMAAVETALAPHGFVRTHRSWLVNAARVRALTAAGSGDFRLDLGCNLTAPLSRRYPAALAKLKDGPQTLRSELAEGR